MYNINSHASMIIILLQLSAAQAQMGEVTSHNISESTRLTYTQVPQTAGSPFYTFGSAAYIILTSYVHVYM